MYKYIFATEVEFLLFCFTIKTIFLTSVLRIIAIKNYFLLFFKRIQVRFTFMWAVNNFNLRTAKPLYLLDMYERRDKTSIFSNITSVTGIRVQFLTKLMSHLFFYYSTNIFNFSYFSKEV